MKITQLPKVRISLYNYGLDIYSFKVAFKANALKQGWTPQQIEQAFFPTRFMNEHEIYDHLIQFAIITKMPKGVQVRKGKIVEQ